MEWLGYLEYIVELIGARLMTLFALVAANILLGFAVALKDKVFDWKLVADFYTSDVFPKLIGYFAVVIIVDLGAAEFMGPELGSAVGSGLLTLAWLAVVVAIGGDILAKLAKLGIGVIERIPGIRAG